MSKTCINNGFININGQSFDKVKEISLSKEKLHNIGKYITSSFHKPNNFFDEDYDLNTGVYIYQSYDNKNEGYRIYKEFADYNFNGYSDDILIQTLQERQKNILKTIFPYGVVTLEGRIIGQQIPYFDNSILLLDYINKFLVLEPIKLYKELLEIIYELYINGIMYQDIHPKNFMIDLTNKKVNLIDFELGHIKFDDLSALKSCLNNYKNTINYINQKLCLLDKLGLFIQINNYEEAFEQLEEMQKKLRY